MIFIILISILTKLADIEELLSETKFTGVIRAIKSY